MHQHTPTTPAEVASLELPAASMLGMLRSHQDRLNAAVSGADPGIAPPAAAHHALAVLAYAHGTAQRVLRDRWRTAQAALVFGASVPQIAAAMGLSAGQVVDGLREWSHELVRAGQMSEGERVQLQQMAANR